MWSDFSVPRIVGLKSRKIKWKSRATKTESLDAEKTQFFQLPIFIRGPKPPFFGWYPPKTRRFPHSSTLNLSKIVDCYKMVLKSLCSTLSGIIIHSSEQATSYFMFLIKRFSFWPPVFMNNPKPSQDIFIFMQCSFKVPWISRWKRPDDVVSKLFTWILKPGSGWHTVETLNPFPAPMSPRIVVGVVCWEVDRCYWQTLFS